MLLVFENGILQRVCGPVQDEESGEWRRQHNNELRDLSRLPPITSHIRSQRLRWAGHLARMENDRGKKTSWKTRMRWSDNFKRDMELL